MQQAEKVLDGPVGDKLLAMLPEKGLVGLAYWENGFFNATNSKHPIAKVEDFAGLKFRAVQAKISQETVKAWAPTRCRWPCPSSTLRWRPARWMARAPYGRDRRAQAQRSAEVPLADPPQLWRLHSAGVQEVLGQTERRRPQILKDAALEARAFQRGVARDQAKSAQAAMAAKGLIVNDVTDAEHDRMREKVQPVWKMFIPSVGEGLYKEVTDQLAAK